MTPWSEDEIQAAIAAEMRGLRDSASARIADLKQQRAVATDPDYADRVDAATLGIARMVKGIGDINESLHAHLMELEDRRLRAFELSAEVRRTGEALQHLGYEQTSGDGAYRAIADALDADRTASRITLLMAIASANAIVADEEAEPMLTVLGDMVKMLLGSVAENIVPGVGFCLDAFEMVRAARTRRTERAEAANTVLADLRLLVTRAEQWHRVHDELGSAFPVRAG